MIDLGVGLEITGGSVPRFLCKLPHDFEGYFRALRICVLRWCDSPPKARFLSLGPQLTLETNRYEQPAASEQDVGRGRSRPSKIPRVSDLDFIRPCLGVSLVIAVAVRIPW